MAQLPKFPLNQLSNQIRCTDCQNHLSVPPIVVVKDTGEYKCGRCSLTGQDRTGANRTHPKELKYKNAVRDSPYEELAKLVLLPCKNRKYGCQSYQKLQQMAEHESICQFTTFRCPVKCCTHRHCGLDSIPDHYRSVHQAEMCVKKWHTHVFTLAKRGSDGTNHRVFFSADEKITFLLILVKTKSQLKLALRSLGTNQVFRFEVKLGSFKNTRSNDGQILVSTCNKVESWGKLVLPEEIDEEEEEYEFQVDFVEKVKQDQQEFKIHVKESDNLKCVKCHKYLSVKPVMATRNGFECGRCFKRNEGIRLKAYEKLAGMVLFPCDELGCDKSFDIGEMKKHIVSHKSDNIK